MVQQRSEISCCFGWGAGGVGLTALVTRGRSSMDPQVPRPRSGRSTSSGGSWSNAPTLSLQMRRRSPVQQTLQGSPSSARTRCEGTGRRQPDTAAPRSPRRNLRRFLRRERLAPEPTKHMRRRRTLLSCRGNGQRNQQGPEGSLVPHRSATRAPPPRLGPEPQLRNPTAASFGILQRHRYREMELESTSPGAPGTKQCSSSRMSHGTRGAGRRPCGSRGRKKAATCKEDRTTSLRSLPSTWPGPRRLCPSATPLPFDSDLEGRQQQQEDRQEGRSTRQKQLQRPPAAG